MALGNFLMKNPKSPSELPVPLVCMKLFSKSRVSLKSLSVPSWEWKKDSADNTSIRWVSQQDPISLSVNYFKGQPDIPFIDELETLQTYYRQTLKKQGGALILVEKATVSGLQAIKAIFKFPQQPSGTMYLGSFTFPFASHSFVVKLHAMELAPTGQRESKVADTLIKQGKLVANEQGEYPGWAADPYNPEFQHSLLMNKAESVQYDLQFPDHPLTLVRTRLTQLGWEIKAHESLTKLAPHIQQKG